MYLPTTDQDNSSRIAFWNSDMTRCVMCGQTNMHCNEVIGGSKANGEEYGTNEYICKTPGCGWSTSFLWDDGSKKCLFFEANSWTLGIEHFPARWMKMWARHRKFPECVINHIEAKNMNGQKLIELAVTVRKIMGEFTVSQRTATMMKIKIDENDPEF